MLSLKPFLWQGTLAAVLLSGSVCGLTNSASLAAVDPSAVAAFPAELRPLVQALQRAGYRVLLAKPPVPGAYGATNARRRQVWLAPITIELGIARQALIHEAVHAAQGCPKGKLRPIGWSLAMIKPVDREVAGVLYRNYPHRRHDVEREAFAMQGDPRAVALITAALQQRCG